MCFISFVFALRVLWAGRHRASAGGAAGGGAAGARSAEAEEGRGETHASFLLCDGPTAFIKEKTFACACVLACACLRVRACASRPRKRIALVGPRLGRRCGTPPPSVGPRPERPHPEERPAADRPAWVLATPTPGQGKHGPQAAEEKLARSGGWTSSRVARRIRRKGSLPPRAPYR